MAELTPADLGTRSTLAVDKHAQYIQSFAEVRLPSREGINKGSVQFPVGLAPLPMIDSDQSKILTNEHEFFPLLYGSTPAGGSSYRMCRRLDTCNR